MLQRSQEIVEVAYLEEALRSQQVVYLAHHNHPLHLMTNLWLLLRDTKELLLQQAYLEQSLLACLEVGLSQLKIQLRLMEVFLVEDQSQLKLQSQHQQEDFLELELSRQMQVKQLQLEVFLEEVQNQQMHHPLQVDYLVELLSLMQISRQAAQYLEDLNQHKQIMQDNPVQPMPNLLPMKLKN